MLLPMSSFREILDKGDGRPSMYLALDKKRKANANHGNTGRVSRTGFDIEVGAHADSGTAVLTYPVSLTSRGSDGLEGLSLGVVSAAGGVEIVHSLFIVNGSKYEEDLPEV